MVMTDPQQPQQQPHQPQQHSMVLPAESNYLQQQPQLQHQQHQQHQQLQQLQPQQHQPHDQKPHESDLHELEIGGEFDAFPHHEECTAILTMKCGEPLMAVRKKLHDDITITFIPEEGFTVFQSKVERHYSKLGKAFAQDKRAIYLKPSSNATQTKYVQLTDSNFDPLLRMRWKIARSMKVDLKYEVFAYFVDLTSKKDKKRLSIKMFHPDAVAASAPEHFGFAPHGFQVVSGPAATHAIQTYADPNTGLTMKPSVTMANSNRLVGSSAVLVNGRDDSERSRKVARTSNGSSTSTGSSNGRSAIAVNGSTGSATQELASLDDEPPSFHAIPFRINGFVVPLEVDVAALKRALGVSLSTAAPVPVPVAPTSGDADVDSQTQVYDR